jgi:hypothetical protein
VVVVSDGLTGYAPRIRGEDAEDEEAERDRGDGRGTVAMAHDGLPTE